MTVGYAQAHDLLERLVAARTRCDGDAWVACFADEAELVLDPFAAPLAGHNALRAYLLRAGDTELDYDLVVERHWVSGSTILASWHAGWKRRDNGAMIRQAGFLSAEVGEDGRIGRLKQWTVSREHPSG
jgi:nuclear transport factor 2 (NTF2) superfamily protein